MLNVSLRQSGYFRKILYHLGSNSEPLPDSNESLYQVRYHGPPIDIDGPKSGTKQTETHITALTDPNFFAFNGPVF
jgi:hypothetical protein